MMLCHFAILTSEVLYKYLYNLKHNFSVIGISETWLQDANYNLYSMDGYKMVEKHREHKRGGRGGSSNLLRVNRVLKKGKI